MRVEEIPVVFDCSGSPLVGVLHRGHPARQRGVLVVVGGPQYRVGSHRQFVLLARALAENGIPVLRFDYRGMGDGHGKDVGFEQIDDDIRSAVDEFFELTPHLEEVVLWGLCDAASAAAFYAAADERVTGLVLLNPWVRSEQGMARAYLTHYYVRRIFSADLWRKVVGGGFSPLGAFKDFIRVLRRSFGRGHEPAAPATEPAGPRPPTGPTAQRSLSARMADGLAAFRGPLLLILSGNDLTAEEFKSAATSRRWRRLLAAGRTCRRDLPAADHTFSSRAWRDQVATWTEEWLLSW